MKARWPILLALVASTAFSVEVTPPIGVGFGASPQVVQSTLSQIYKFVGPGPALANPDEFLHEQRYTGDVLGMTSDHIAPLFFASRLFGVAISYSPTPTNPASMIWEKLVTKLTKEHGKPRLRTKPMKLISLEAVLRLLPDSANKGQLMELYNTAARDRELGEYIIQDLQIQTRLWIPEAIWDFGRKTSVKVVMRAGAPDQNGLTALKPAVIYTDHDQLK